MQQCFESRNIEQLQNVLSNMSQEDAAYHLDRCIKSGLWIPNAKDAERDDEDEAKTKQDDNQDKVIQDVEKLQVEQ